MDSAKRTKDKMKLDERVETEAELHLKQLLAKQLDTNTNLSNELSKCKQFVSNSKFEPFTRKLHGKVTYEEFSEFQKQDNQYETLRSCNLTDSEISIKLESLQGSRRSKFGRNPDAEKSYIKYIDEKIKEKELSLSVPDTFIGKRTLNRHQLDLENSLLNKLHCEKSTVLKRLTTSVNDSDINQAHPMYRLKEMADELTYFKKKRKTLDETTIFQSGSPDLSIKKPNQFSVVASAPTSTLAKEEHDPSGDDSVTNDCAKPHVFIGPVKSLTVEEIIKNRLTVAEIKEIPRFKNYTPGTETNVLYLKNLPNGVTESDLVALFYQFQKPQDPKILFQVLTGRMRGQAFITFDKASTATEALNLVNGYILTNRPVIIQYGHGPKSKN